MFLIQGLMQALLCLWCSSLLYAASPNVLLIVLDDVGVDVIGAYKEGSAPAHTPTIDHLATTGVLFRNAWANPVCSPTRATLLTGRHAFRHGVGFPIGDDSDPVLSASEILLPAALKRGGAAHSSALIGKWHVSRGHQDPTGFGFTRFAGRIEGDMPDYYNWQKVTDGSTSTSTVYATTDNIDDALAWLGTQSGPWFLSVNCSAPHIPIHAPPATLHGNKELTGSRRDLRRKPLAYHNAMMEAVDTEVNRLLNGLGAQRAQTCVMVIGDNGTWGKKVVQAPFIPERAKGTLYEGGVNVPLIVSGAGVIDPGREVTHLVHAVDLFATIADICGGDASTGTDSISFHSYLTDADAAARRSTVYTEMFGSGNSAADGWAVRDGRYKLISFADGRQEYYDLSQDPFEQQNLLQGALSNAQQNRLDTLRDSVSELKTQSSN